MQAQGKRCGCAVMPRYKRSDISIDSVRAPRKRHHLERRSCGVPAACTRRPRGAQGDLTALLLRRSCVATALIQIAVGTPSHCAHFVHAQNARRGMAS